MIINWLILILIGLDDY